MTFWFISKIKIKAKVENNNILSYLDSIQEIINNPENSPEKAQSLIENSWISILLEQLNDEKKLINKYSYRFANIFLEANKTLNSLQENNIIKKKFPLFFKDLNSMDFIFLTYTICIAYSNRTGYTSLAELVGDNILYRVFKKSKDSNYTDFKNKVKDSYRLSIKIGDFFISLLTQFPHDLFESVNIYKEDLGFYSLTRVIKAVIPINDKIVTLLMHKNINDDLIKKLNSTLNI